MPRVTAIVPSHNGAAFVRAAIDSALNQTFGDLEVVVADDASRDDTADILASFDSRVRVVPVDYGNTQATRNAAIDASDSELIALLDQDDVWWPRKIERQLARFDADPRFGLCYTATRGVDREGREIPGTRLRLEVPESQTEALGRLLSVNLMTASSVLLPRHVLDRVGPFHAAFHLAGDWDLWLRVAQEHPIAAVPEVLTDYRWHGENLSRNPIPMLQETISVQEAALARIAAHPHWAADPGLTPYLGPARRRLASRYSELGMRYARTGSRAKALASHRRALHLGPLIARHWWRFLRSLIRLHGWRPGETR